MSWTLRPRPDCPAPGVNAITDGEVMRVSGHLISKEICSEGFSSSVSEIENLEKTEK
jgi:hypothetical protein